MPYPTPTDAERAFYDAFTKRDLAAMRDAWSQEPDVICLHPGGPPLLGPADVMASWSDIFHGAAAPRLQVRALQTQIDGDTAIHVVEERIENSVENRAAVVIATNVYRRTPSGWSMRLHHASLPLVEDTPAGAPALH